MNETSRSRIERMTVAGRKVTALSFIVIILIANFWIIKRFTAEPLTSWSQDIFYIGVCGAALGFLLMLPGLVYTRVLTDHSGENEENPKDDR